MDVAGVGGGAEINTSSSTIFTEEVVNAAKNGAMTGAMVGTGLIECVAGACPGTKITDQTLKANMKPIQYFGRAVMGVSLYLEYQKYKKAVASGNKLDQVDSIVDMAAEVPGVFLGRGGAMFSYSYSFTDNSFGPALASGIADGALFFRNGGRVSNTLNNWVVDGACYLSGC